MARSATVAMRDRIEDAGFQFLRDEAGWALYDSDDRREMPGCRAKQLGNAIWAAAETLGLTTEEET